MRSLLRLSLLLPSLVPVARSAAQHSCPAHELTAQHTGVTALAQDRPTAQQALRGGNATIPVVVHVVWNAPAENVPDAAIAAMVASMDQDLQGLNADLANIRPAFAGVQDAPLIGFCLATVDPQGNPTTGITRMQTSDDWFDPTTEPDAMKAPPSGMSPWDPTSYLNIWICDISSGLSGTVVDGYAYLPVGGMAGSPVDGIVIDPVHGMAPGSRTATHEAGHYLGLLHPWGTLGACTDDDGLADTPLTDGPTYLCFPPNLMRCGTLTQYENFMDYGACQCMFTVDQSAVMSAVLNGVRSSLLVSSGCTGSVGIADPYPRTPAWRVRREDGALLVEATDGRVLDGHFRLLDGMGRTLMEATIASSPIRVPTSSFPAGTLVVLIDDRDGRYAVRVMIE